jgi:hypothetical protein
MLDPLAAGTGYEGFLFGKAYSPVWLLKNNLQVLLCRKMGADLKA